MHILLVSDSPYVNSGYAIQAWYLATGLVQAGFKVYYFAASLQSKPHERDGVVILGNPTGHADPFGSSTMQYYANRYKCDVIFTFKDPYVYNAEAMANLTTPWYALCPVDTEPLSAANAIMLQHAKRPVALTRHGFDALSAAGFKPMYAPHGIDLSTYKPYDKAQCREKFNMRQEAFIFGFVGANQSNPSRKSIETILLAFAQFVQRYPNAVLYMHTIMNAAAGGVDILNMVRLLGIPEGSLLYTDGRAYISGLDPAELAQLYSSFDVLLNPATGGGFELCGVEAQACGTPVITTDYTAMRETVYAGWHIQTKQRSWSHFGAYRAALAPADLLQAMEQVYHSRPHHNIIHHAVNGARRYDIDHVINQYWVPLFKRIEREIEQDKVARDSQENQEAIA